MQEFQRINRRGHDEEHWNEVHEQLLIIQKKSREISDPDDANEKEADAVARKVSNGESTEIHGTGGTINRKGEGSFETTSEFNSKLDSSKGGGKSLDDSTKSEMESKMGADFSSVKIHTGSEANEMNKSVNAKALTNGPDIYFGEGEYEPESADGKNLLAHELVHTVQQGENLQRKIQRRLDDNGNYIVEKGDSAYRIAGKLKVDVHELLMLNGLKLVTKTVDGETKEEVVDAVTGEKHVMHPGDVLKVPQRKKTETPLFTQTSKRQYTREQQYEIALALEDFDRDKVTGYDEYKPGGFLYNPSKSYNQLIIMRKTTGNPDLQIKDLETMANYNDGYYFDLGTTAGRIMYSEKMKLKGDKYTPSQELIDQQNVEMKGDAQVKQDLINGLYFYSQVVDLLQEKIASTKDATEKKRLTGKKQVLVTELAKITDSLNKEYKKQNKLEKDQDPAKPKVQEANAARGVLVAWELITLAVLTISTVFAIYALYQLSRVIGDLFKDVDLDWTKVRVPKTTTPGKETKPDDLPKPDPKWDPGRIPPVPPVFPKPPKDDCIPTPLGYHRGGDQRHDELADRVPPNMIPGTDWTLKGKAFDSWTGSPKKEIWEVKTAVYSTYNTFVKSMELNKIIADVVLEKPIADACGLHYVLGVTDSLLKHHLLNNTTIQNMDVDIRIIS